MNFHPLVIYMTGSILLTTYGGYLIHFSLLRNNSFSFYYALTNHAISSLLIVLAALTGFAAEGLENTEKVSALLLTPHKVLAMALVLLTLLSFIYLWIKQRDSDRKLGLIISLTGLILTLVVILLGWRIRLILA